MFLPVQRDCQWCMETGGNSHRSHMSPQCLRWEERRARERVRERERETFIFAFSVLWIDWWTHEGKYSGNWIESTKYTLYLALTGELWGIFCKNLKKIDSVIMALHCILNSHVLTQVLSYLICPLSMLSTVKPVYNDHLMGYFSAFWSSSRWPRATWAT